MTINNLPGVPNNIIQNPTVRKVAGNVLGVATLVTLVAVLVDTSIPAIEYSEITTPAALIIGGLFGIFQLTVTSPNVPTPSALTKTAAKAGPQAGFVDPNTGFNTPPKDSNGNVTD